MVNRGNLALTRYGWGDDFLSDTGSRTYKLIDLDVPDEAENVDPPWVEMVFSKVSVVSFAEIYPSDEQTIQSEVRVKTPQQSMSIYVDRDEDVRSLHSLILPAISLAIAALAAVLCAAFALKSLFYQALVAGLVSFLFLGFSQTTLYVRRRIRRHGEGNK